jgi:hypothetical protein
MPITFIFAALFFLGIILAVVLVPVSIILLILKMKKAALCVFLFPVGILAFSVGMTLFIFGHMYLHNFKLNLQPSRIFNDTFGFKPDKQTEILEAYTEHGLDYETTLIKFRTTKDTIDKIVRDRFDAVPSETFKKKYGANRHNLPGHVRAWFTPDYEKPNLFYLAEPFNNSFSNVNEAILCYNEETGIAYFHWSGLD